MEALKHIQELNPCRYTIFTDSKSALDTFKNIHGNSKINYITARIIKLIHTLHEDGKVIALVWVKSHCGINNNEEVDKAAKEALHSGEIKDYLITPEDLMSTIKNQHLMKWQEEYLCSEKGRYYKYINPCPNKKPWFTDIPTNKKFVSTLARLRINHGLFPSHKYKINLSQNDNCECGDRGDAEHIILNCNLRQKSVQEFIKKIKNTYLIQPFNLTDILRSNNLEIYLILYEYIEKNKITI